MNFIKKKQQNLRTETNLDLRTLWKLKVPERESPCGLYNHWEIKVYVDTDQSEPVK